MPKKIQMVMKYVFEFTWWGVCTLWFVIGIDKIILIRDDNNLISINILKWHVII